MVGLKDIAESAQGLHDLLLIREHLAAIKQSQTELSNALEALGDRIRKLETDFAVIKEQTKFEALKETQLIVNAVQGNIYQRIEGLTVKIALMEQSVALRNIALPSPNIDNN